MSRNWREQECAETHRVRRSKAGGTGCHESVRQMKAYGIAYPYRHLLRQGRLDWCRWHAGRTVLVRQQLAD